MKGYRNNTVTATALPHSTVAGLLLKNLINGCVAQLAERRSLAGELTMSCARPAVDG